jgi:glutaredoxin
MISISAPQLITSGNLTRLQAEIQIDDNTAQPLFFEVGNKYASFLTVDRADAFVVALIPLIAKYGGGVVVKSRLSSHLYFSLKHILSPILSQVSPQWSPLKQIECDLTSDLIQRSVNGVGTGCSAGVDSLATIAQYTAEDTPADLRLTHALFLNAGSHNMYAPTQEEKEELAQRLYEGRRENARALCQEIGLELIEMNTNLFEFVDEYNHQAMHSFWDSACVLALQNLFAHYMYASTYHLTSFKFAPKDPAYYEPLLLECFSTENTQLHSSLSTLYRYERTKIVSEFPASKKYLNVCLREVANCGHCHKCIRTMFQLDLLGALDGFKQVFPVDLYRHNPEQVMENLKKDTGYYDEYIAQFNATHPNEEEQRSFATQLLTSPSEILIKTPPLSHIKRMKLEYYRCKILSFVTFGKKHRHYKEKRLNLKSQLRSIKGTIH